MRSATTSLLVGLSLGLGLGLSVVSCGGEQNALFIHLANVPSRTTAVTVNATLNNKPAMSGLDIPSLLTQFAVRFDPEAVGHAKLTVEALDSDRCTIGNSVSEYDLPSDFVDITLGLNAIGPRKCGALPACASGSLCAATKPANYINTVEAMYAFAPNDIWAAGLKASLLHFDGTAWSVYQWPAGTAPITDYYGIWGSAPNDIWAVGTAGGMAHYDGTKWSDVPPVVAPTLFGVWGVGKNKIWAVGDQLTSTAPGTVVQYDGTSWQPVATPGQDRLNAVWADSNGTSTLVYACGQNGSMVRLDTEKSAVWANIVPITGFHLHSIWGTPQRTLFAVGDQGTIIRIRYTIDTGWAPITKTGTTNTLWAVRGDGTQVVYAVGNGSTVIRADAPYDSFSNLNGTGGASLFSIVLASNGLVWTGGTSGYLGFLDLRP